MIEKSLEEQLEALVELARQEEMRRNALKQPNISDLQIIDEEFKEIKEGKHLSKGKYLVHFDIVIEEGGLLTLEPGTDLYFASDYGISARGALLAQATEQERIEFSAAKGRWKNISITENSMSVLENCVIHNGSSGLYIGGSSAVVRRCFISGNLSKGYGGGIHITGGSPIIQDTIIHGNRAEYGGGIEISHASPTIERCTIIGNIAENNGGGICLDCSKPTLRQNTIRNNVAKCGGGLYIDGSVKLGGPHPDRKGSFPVQRDNIIADNEPDNIFTAKPADYSKDRAHMDAIIQEFEANMRYRIKKQDK